MNISLTKHFDEFVARQVESGRYNNGSEVIRAALRLLEEQDQVTKARLEALRVSIQRGAGELDRGEGRPLDPERIKKQGRKRLAAEKHNQYL